MAPKKIYEFTELNTFHITVEITPENLAVCGDEINEGMSEEELLDTIAIHKYQAGTEIQVTDLDINLVGGGLEHYHELKEQMDA
jgi:hypothetical protein